MIILFETDRLKIEHTYEKAFLIDKQSGKILMFDYFYGDPSCGLIGSDQNYPKYYLSWDFIPNPTYSFSLMKKVSKKIKAAGCFSQ